MKPIQITLEILQTFLYLYNELASLLAIENQLLSGWEAFRTCNATY